MAAAKRPRPASTEPVAARYGATAIALHWLIAALIAGQLALGWFMVDLPIGDSTKFSLYQLHKSLGFSIFALSLARLAWRIAHPPPPPSTSSRPERLAARATHFALYALMLGLPLTGWLMVSASPWGVPTVLFGWIEAPHLPALAHADDKAGLEAAFKRAHSAAAWALIALLALHVAAALRHHFLLRDDTLRRMLPRAPR